jgi:hypothetical protein
MAGQNVAHGKKKSVCTSGNVPFEKTIKRQVCECGELAVMYDEESLYLSASTVADDDELSPDFGHD